MKKICALCVFLMLVMIATPGVAEIDIELAYVEAESLAGTLGWGDKTVDEIATSYSQYGNYYDQCANHDAAMVTYPCADNPAEYTFTWECGSAQTLVIRHLDGIADDSFIVETYWNPDYGQGCYKSDIGNWVVIGCYDDNDAGTETWIETSFCLQGYGHWVKGTGQMRIRIILVDSDHLTWPSWTTFGQLAIDWMELRGNGIEI